MKQTVFLTGTFATLLLTATLGACSSTEKLGFTGRQEGISAYAVCLIEKS